MSEWVAAPELWGDECLRSSNAVAVAQHVRLPLAGVTKLVGAVHWNVASGVRIGFRIELAATVKP